MEPRDLSDHSPYVPGRGVEEVARELGVDRSELIKLSSNENPHGPSPAAVEAIREHADRVNVYPKSSHTDLTARIAEQWDVDPEQVWVSPGADGSIDYLSRAALEPDDQVLVPDPGFAYYAMAARYHHAEVTEYALSADDGFEQTAEAVLTAYGGERVVYLTSPHNPSGSVFHLDAIRAIADATAEETLVVVDEAYGEFAGVDSAIPLVDERDDVAVLRTFSKAYGLAGLRIGYSVVPERWGGAYARVNTPFAANELACRAALAAVHRVVRPGGRFVVFDAQPYQTGPERLLNPLMDRVSAWATNWYPDRDVPALLRETFGTVDVTTYNSGSAFLATATVEP